MTAAIAAIVVLGLALVLSGIGNILSWLSNRKLAAMPEALIAEGKAHVVTQHNMIAVEKREAAALARAAKAETERDAAIAKLAEEQRAHNATNEKEITDAANAAAAGDGAAGLAALDELLSEGAAPDDSAPAGDATADDRRQD